MGVYNTNILQSSQQLHIVSSMYRFWDSLVDKQPSCNNQHDRGDYYTIPEGCLFTEES